MPIHTRHPPDTHTGSTAPTQRGAGTCPPPVDTPTKESKDAQHSNTHACMGKKVCTKHLTRREKGDTMKAQRKRRRRPMKTKTQKMAQDARKKSMSKKALQEYNKSRRTLVLMNTGTQTHKSKKDYNRQESKRATREASTEE